MRSTLESFKWTFLEEKKLKSGSSRRGFATLTKFVILWQEHNNSLALNICLLMKLNSWKANCNEIPAYDKNI